MDFREADRRYADLRQRYDNGSLGVEEFDAQLEQIMVQDGEGRWWAKSRETGEWHYHDDASDTWVQGIPPGYHREPGPDQPKTQAPRQRPYTSPTQPTQPVYHGVRAPGANVPGYLLPASIAATLLCCLPTGIAAIVYSVQAGSKSQVGDTAGASQAVQNARLWLWISVGAGLVVYFLAFASGIFSA